MYINDYLELEIHLKSMFSISNKHNLMKFLVFFIDFTFLESTLHILLTKKTGIFDSSRLKSNKRECSACPFINHGEGGTFVFISSV